MRVRPQKSKGEARRPEPLERYKSPDAPFRHGIERIAHIAALQFDVPAAVISIFDGDERRFIAAHGLDSGHVEQHASLCAQTARQDGVFVIPDVLQDPRFRDEPIFGADPKVRFYAGVPLKAPNGETVGSLCLMDVKPRPAPTDRQKALLSELGSIAGDVLEMCTVCSAKTGLLAEVQMRIATEKRLSSAEQKLCLLFEYAPVAIAMFNRDMEYLAASRRWREFYKLGDGQIFGRSHFDLIPDMPERWKVDYRRCLDGEALRWDEDYFERPDGTADWILREMHPWFDMNGEVGGIIVFNEVVTERKRAADELERHQRFLNAVLESVQEGIVACDENGMLSIFNSAAKRMLEADALAIPPERWAEVYQIYEADGRTLLKTKELPLVRALRGEIVENEELVLAPNAQSPRRIICNAQAMHTRGGEKIGAVVSMQDVTERVEIEARYRQAQKMEAVGQLTGGLAHDFNNLLAVILGNLQLLQRTLKDDDQSAHRAAAALVAAQRGAELTNRLLLFARKQTLEARPIDVNALIKSLDSLLSRTLGETISLETALADDLWTIHADEAQLEAAILNLAINARDAMQDGGRLTIETRNVTLDEAYARRESEVRPGEYVLISVSDKGCGMAEEIRNKVFEPFFTTKEVGKGSGLGLSMVYGFIKQSEGHIKIYSEEGCGTTVHMYFPRNYRPPTHRDEPAHQDCELSGNSERVLVVEDDPAVRDVAVALLQDLGYQTVEASNGRVALEILQSSGDSFDLLLTDVVMPGELNGPDLAKIVKARFPHIKVLLTSGYAEAALLREGEIRGGMDLVGKPILRQDLAQKMRQALDRPPG